MSGRVWAIALNTFREAARNKVLYGVVVVVVLWNFFGLVIGEMSLHEEARVARDVGLFGVSFFGAITAIVLGVLLLYNEVEKKTIHTIISKPIERHEFVLGKYLGMVGTLSVLVVLFTLALALLLWMNGLSLLGNPARAVVLAYFEVLIVAALAIFFSSFSTPFLSGIFTLGLYVIGSWTSEMRAAAAHKKDAWIRLVAKIGLRVVPDLDVFSISGGEVNGQHVTVHGSFVPWTYVGTSAVYAATWIALLLVAAALVFRQRDFV
jgi:ABC-type transport system involved in multi-copper enzyme maturation permease subunit